MGCLGFACVTPVALADTPINTGLAATAQQSQSFAPTPITLPVLVGNIISAVLGLLGIIFLVMLVYAGMKWFLARGNPGDVKEAIGTITNAVIGLIIVLAAYALAQFVVTALINATTGS